MAKNKSAFPGKTQFDQAMNCIGAWIFEHGLRGDLDIAVSTRRIATTTTHYRPFARRRHAVDVQRRRP